LWLESAAAYLDFANHAVVIVGYDTESGIVIASCEARYVHSTGDLTRSSVPIY
jgi:C1A family cysteine protease